MKESEEFYDLMQAYRHCTPLPPEAALNAYHAVIDYITDRERSAFEAGVRAGSSYVDAETRYPMSHLPQYPQFDDYKKS
jgi:hypothetical protein